VFDVNKNMRRIGRRVDVPAFLKAANLNGLVVEVGVRYGYHLRQLLSANPELLIGIDTYADTGKAGSNDTGIDNEQLNRLYLDVVTRFLPHENTRIIRSDSTLAAEAFPLYSADYVYLDADHTYEGCKRDIKAWWPNVRQGGILAGHDYVDVKARSGAQFGVVNAVDEFVKSKNLQGHFHHTSFGYRSWFIYKLDGE